MARTRTSQWQADLEQSVRSQVVSVQALSGGDICEAYRVELAAGPRVFVKTHSHPPPGMFASEAAGLALLADAGSGLVIPQVLAQAEHYLALTWLVPDASDQSEALGRGLARLHMSQPQLHVPTAPWGASFDGVIGTLPQHNQCREDCSWVDFFREQRLVVQLQLPAARRLLVPALRVRLDALLARLEEFLPTAPRPAPLHGDLWSGNHAFTANGPAIFDPASYVGHAEVDLAMMRLFGGFNQRVFAAYDELTGRVSGQEQRLAIYQLYPLLVHVNLFGASYLVQLEATLRRLGF